MRFIADFHLHSKYSRATSKDMDLENLDKWAKIKGIKVLGTADFTHPEWFKNLKEKLWKLNQNLEEFTEQEVKQVLSTVNSYYGQFRHAKTFGLRQKLWQKNFGKLREILKPVDDNFSYFKIK